MLDISDGLVLDARRVARASGVAFDLSSEAVVTAARAVAMAAGVAMAEVEIVADLGALKFALDGGEDHSLLATFPPDGALPDGFAPIGAVVAVENSHSPLVCLDGREYDATGGWDPYEGWLGAGG